MDVDGTLTDGKLYIGANGEEFKAFNIKDGYGIKDILPRYGIIPIIITGRSSASVTVRSKEIKIQEVYQGISNKEEKLKEILEKYNASLEECAYIGDDCNDASLISLCGFSGCPADAVPEIKQKADYICSIRGGEGCVREFIYEIIKYNEGLNRSTL